MAKVKVTNLVLSIAAQSPGTIIASWKAPGKKTSRWRPEIKKGKKTKKVVDALAGYSFSWTVVYSTVKTTDSNGKSYYKNVKIKETTGTVGKSETATSFSIPEGAKEIRFSIKPTSKKYKDKKGREKDYFAGVAVPASRAISAIAEKPSAPSIRIENGKLIATLQNLNAGLNSARFQVIRDNNSKVWKTVDNVAISTGQASIYIPIEPGHQYKVRACVWGTNATVSPYSDYSENYDSDPKAPTRLYLKAYGYNSVLVSWDAAGGSSATYELEWYSKPKVSDPANFDTTSQKSSQTCPTNSWIVEGLASGTWYFRVRTVEGNGKSSWCKEYNTITLGKPPSPPTTYTLVSSIKVGETIDFYWVHNSEDGSPAVYALLELTYSSSIMDPVVETIQVDNDNYGNPFGQDSANMHFSLDTSIDRSGVSFTEGVNIEWRVKTIGPSNTGSDWSVKRRVDVWAEPYLNILVSSNLGGWLWDPFNFAQNTIYDAPRNVYEEVDGDDVLNNLPVGVDLNCGPVTQTPLGYYIEISASESYTYQNEFGETVNVTEGQIIFSQYYTVTKRHWVALLTPFNVDFEDGQSYQLKAIVTMNSGLTATETYNFTIDWEEIDMYADADVVVDPTSLFATITPYCRNAATISELPDDIEDGDEIPEDLVIEPELVDNVVLSVYRKSVNGEFVEIATEIPNDTAMAITDPHPTLDEVSYRIVAYKTDTGQVAFGDTEPADVPQSGIVISWDESWTNVTNDMNYDEGNEESAEMDETEYSGTQLRLPFNVDIGEQMEPDVNLIKYIGRKRPVSYYGTQLGESATWKTAIPKLLNPEDSFGELMPSPDETVKLLRRLAIHTGDVYVRESSGRTGYWANVKASWDIDHSSLIIPVSFTITRVEGGM